MQSLSITELRSIAKSRDIKKYNQLDKDEVLKNILLSSLSFNESRLISKLRKIKNYKNISEDELQNALKNSKLPFEDNKEIKKKNQDDDEIIRDLRFLYEKAFWVIINFL